MPVRVPPPLSAVWMVHKGQRANKVVRKALGNLGWTAACAGWLAGWVAGWLCALLAGWYGCLLGIIEVIVCLGWGVWLKSRVGSRWDCVEES